MQSEFDVQIVYRHFPLHPETPQEGLTLEQLFQGRGIDIDASKRRMKQLLAEEGLAIGDRPKTYNSRLAQELACWAVETTGTAEIHDQLFHAYFVGDVNLAMTENLVKVAADCGLDADEALNILNQRTMREKVDDDWNRSRQLGITGVPTFVSGGYMLAGAQPIEQLRRLMEVS